eukprot:g5651.t1
MGRIFSRLLKFGNLIQTALPVASSFTLKRCPHLLIPCVSVLIVSFPRLLSQNARPPPRQQCFEDFDLKWKDACRNRLDALRLFQLAFKRSRLPNLRTKGIAQSLWQCVKDFPGSSHEHSRLPTWHKLEGVPARNGPVGKIQESAEILRQLVRLRSRRYSLTTLEDPAFMNEHLKKNCWVCPKRFIGKSPANLQLGCKRVLKYHEAMSF